MAARGRRNSPGRASASPKRVLDCRLEVGRLVASLPTLDKSQLLLRWRNYLGGTPPAHLPSWLLARVLAFGLQAQAFGEMSAAMLRRIQRDAEGGATSVVDEPLANRGPMTREGAELRPGAMLAREWRGKLELVSKATGWLEHSTRAALTGLRYRGYELRSTRGEQGSVSVYRVAARGHEAAK